MMVYRGLHLFEHAKARRPSATAASRRGAVQKLDAIGQVASAVATAGRPLHRRIRRREDHLLVVAALRGQLLLRGQQQGFSLLL